MPILADFFYQYLLLIDLLYGFQKLGKLIRAGGHLVSARDAGQPLLYVRNLMTFRKGGDAFQIAVASAVEGDVKDFISEELEFDCLGADSFWLSHDSPHSAVECIVYYLHFYIGKFRQESQPNG